MCVWFTTKCVLLQLFCWCTSTPWKLIFLCSAHVTLSTAIQSDPKSACICCHTATNGLSLIRRRRGHFVLQNNGHRPFCVRTNQWKDEPASSEDGHMMPWVQMMLICAQPWRWWWSKWWCDSSSGSNAQSHNFRPTPWKHVKPKRWNRWKDYSLLISCCPSRG